MFIEHTTTESRDLGPAPVAPPADPFDLARAEVMLRGYDARWGGDTYEVIAVEREFRAPLVNPDTGAASRTFTLGGKLDVLVREIGGRGRNLVIEHKTTSEDACAGSDYIKRLRLDAQVSIYFDGAASVFDGDVDGCIYDVLVKPGIRPHSATPAESRKYTKDGRLYANQRENDETPAEFRARLIERVTASPDDHYVRAEVVRLDGELDDARRDAWELGREMRESELAGRFPRNPDACVRYGRTCEFFGVCTGEARIDNPAEFTKQERAHAELSDAAGLDLITASRLSAFRRCKREHKHRYLDGYRANREAATLRFGTLIHTGLEAWWKAAPDARLSAALAAIGI